MRMFKYLLVERDKVRGKEKRKSLRDWDWGIEKCSRIVSSVNIINLIF